MSGTVTSEQKRIEALELLLREALMDLKCKEGFEHCTTIGRIRHVLKLRDEQLQVTRIEVCPDCMCSNVLFQSWSACNTNPPTFFGSQDSYVWCLGCEAMRRDGDHKGTEELDGKDPRAWTIPVDENLEPIDAEHWPAELKEKIAANLAAAGV